MPLHRASFQVKNVFDSLAILYTQSVLHHKNMYNASTLHLDCENSIDLCKETLGVSTKVIGKRREISQEQVHLIFRHRFDNEPLIVAKEEETATPASSLTSFKKVSYVELWGETEFKYLWLLVDLSKCLYKLSILVKGDFNFVVNLNDVAMHSTQLCQTVVGSPE